MILYLLLLELFVAAVFLIASKLCDSSLVDLFFLSVSSLGGEIQDLGLWTYIA